METRKILNDKTELKLIQKDLLSTCIVAFRRLEAKSYILMISFWSLSSLNKQVMQGKHSNQIDDLMLVAEFPKRTDHGMKAFDSEKSNGTSNKPKNNRNKGGERM